MAFGFLPRDEFHIGLDEAFYVAQSAMTVEHGENRKVRSWVASV